MFKNISRSNSHYSQTSLAQITYDDNKISFVIKKRKNKKTKNKWRKGWRKRDEKKKETDKISKVRKRGVRSKRVSHWEEKKGVGWCACGSGGEEEGNDSKRRWRTEEGWGGGGKMQRESIGERERGRERLIVLIPPQAPLGLRPG